MWRELTAKEINELDTNQDEVLITEVGDGEYSFNTFGNAFKDIGTMLRIFRGSTTWYRKILLVTTDGRYQAYQLSPQNTSRPLERIYIGGAHERYLTLLASVRKVSIVPTKVERGCC